MLSRRRIDIILNLRQSAHAWTGHMTYTDAEFGAISYHISIVPFSRSHD